MADNKQKATTNPPKLNTAVADASDLSTDLTSPVSPTTPHQTADAKRAMSATAAWKPALDRRQSWDNQEYKHKLQMTGISDVKTGPGFTERK